MGATVPPVSPWPSRDPADYLEVRVPRLACVLFLTGAWVLWLVVVRWLLVHADHLHASWNDTTCLTPAPRWARAQAAVALPGLLLGAFAAGLYLRHRLVMTRPARLALACSAAFLIAWGITVFAFDPRVSRGNYAGCGLS